jgi:hypothetical protein
MLILRNYTISNNKEKIKFATIKEGDDIVAVPFIAAKPQKKGKFAISLQQSKEGGDSCCLLLLQYKVAAFFAMLQGQKKKKTKQKKKVTTATVTFFVKLRFQKREKKATAALLPSLASLRCSSTSGRR